MIDVIFLLLTFFVYSMAMMIRASVLPVQLTPLGSGRPTNSDAVQAITVAKDGKIYFNRDAVSYEGLDQRLTALAKDAHHPPVYLAMEAAGVTDRGPVLFNVIERLRLAGINNFVIVGQPKAEGGK